MKAFEFTGSGTEYFKIWIVNTLLTIVTLGIYYPWAKVRNNRYIYGNTSIEEKAFDYHATGKQLFFGYLIALFFLFLYNVLEYVLPIGNIVLIIFLLAIVPWLVWRSMKFNLRVTSFNNVRFSFVGGVAESYVIFLLVPLISFLALGITIYLLTLFEGSVISIVLGILLTNTIYVVGFAYFSVIKNRYIIYSTTYGDSEFDINICTTNFIKIILKTVGVSFLLFIITASIIGTIVYFSYDLNYFMNLSETYKTDPKSAIMIIYTTLLPLLAIGYILMIALSTIAYAYYMTETRAYIFKNTILDNDIEFLSNMKFLPYSYILVTNFLLILFTLGLAYPWAKVRVLKYAVENTSINFNNNFNGFINSKLKKESGFGEQVSDTLDVDIGIPL